MVKGAGIHGLRPPEPKWRCDPDLVAVDVQMAEVVFMRVSAVAADGGLV